jgi:hypothetical protein
MSVSNFSADPFLDDLADFQKVLVAAEVQEVLDALTAQQMRDDAIIAHRLASGISQEDWALMTQLTDLDFAEMQVAQNEAARVCQADRALAIRLERGDG